MAPLIDPNFNAPVRVPISTSTRPRTTYTLSDDVTGTITQFDNRVWSASFAGVGLYPSTRQVRDGRVLYAYKVNTVSSDNGSDVERQGPDGYSGSDP